MHRLRYQDSRLNANGAFRLRAEILHHRTVSLKPGHTLRINRDFRGFNGVKNLPFRNTLTGLTVPTPGQIKASGDLPE